MSTLPPDELRARLFEIVSRQRSIHRLPGVLRPIAPQPFAGTELFRPGMRRQRILELGAGWGEFLEWWLEHNVEDDYIAFELKPERIRRALRRVSGLPGPPRWLRIVPVNFNWFLEELLPAASFDWIMVNFPDPWPKRRHWKHRLVRPGFCEKMAALLRPDGVIHLATDYGPYARRMLRLFRDSPAFVSEFLDPDYRRQRPADVASTRFESLTTRLRPAYYLRFRRSDESGK